MIFLALSSQRLAINGIMTRWTDAALFHCANQSYAQGREKMQRFSINHTNQIYEETKKLGSLCQLHMKRRYRC